MVGGDCHTAGSWTGDNNRWDSTNCCETYSYAEVVVISTDPYSDYKPLEEEFEADTHYQDFYFGKRINYQKIKFSKKYIYNKKLSWQAKTQHRCQRGI